MKLIAPFANESESLSVGELTIENRTDRVVLYGSLELTKDKAGLEHARILEATLRSIVHALQSDQNLPERVPVASTPEQVKNPFN